MDPFEYHVHEQVPFSECEQGWGAVCALCELASSRVGACWIGACGGLVGGVVSFFLFQAFGEVVAKGGLRGDAAVDLFLW